jgi:hypothetical protein
MIRQRYRRVQYAKGISSINPVRGNPLRAKPFRGRIKSPPGSRMVPLSGKKARKPAPMPVVCEVREPGWEKRMHTEFPIFERNVHDAIVSAAKVAKQPLAMCLLAPIVAIFVSLIGMKHEFSGMKGEVARVEAKNNCLTGVVNRLGQDVQIIREDVEANRRITESRRELLQIVGDDVAGLKRRLDAAEFLVGKLNENGKLTPGDEEAANRMRRVQEPLDRCPRGKEGECK